MDEKDDTTPFPREPWQRLLDDAPDGPPETTDARIRAAARRDLAPRGHRWWLPASLAASFVLAVFVVQSQFGTLRVPVADRYGGAGGTIEARIIDREEADAARPSGSSEQAQPSRSAAPARSEQEPDVYGYEDSEQAGDSAGTGPMIGGPERELQEAMRLPDQAAAPVTSQGVTPPPPAVEAPDEIAVTGSVADHEKLAQATPATTKIRPPPFEKSPESWYAYIEKLRARGKVEEADRQLERLEKAYPGWVDRYLRDRTQE